MPDPDNKTPTPEQLDLNNAVHVEVFGGSGSDRLAGNPSKWPLLYSTDPAAAELVMEWLRQNSIWTNLHAQDGKWLAIVCISAGDGDDPSGEAETWMEAICNAALALVRARGDSRIENRQRALRRFACQCRRQRHRGVGSRLCTYLHRPQRPARTARCGECGRRVLPDSICDSVGQFACRPVAACGGEVMTNLSEQITAEMTPEQVAGAFVIKPTAAMSSFQRSMIASERRRIAQLIAADRAAQLAAREAGNDPKVTMPEPGSQIVVEVAGVPLIATVLHGEPVQFIAEGVIQSFSVVGRWWPLPGNGGANGKA